MPRQRLIRRFQHPIHPFNIPVDTMDKKDKQAARKSRDISTKLDEEDLWELEDDWSDEEEAPRAGEIETVAEPDATVQEPELDLKHEPEDEPAMENEPVEETIPTTPISLNEEVEKADPEPEANEEPGKEADGVEDPTENSAEGLPSGPLGSITAPATVALKKLSLNKTEKIALGILTAVLAGLAIWGCFWLSGKNKIANTRETIDLPAAGEYATITGLDTFWITPKKESGVNLNAVVVPSITITLDREKSSDGALRLFFRNTKGDSIGDPITLPFENGQFSTNGTNTIEVAASDGFREEGQFHAYQVDDSTPWRVHILEAPSASSPGAGFTNLIDAPVEAKRK